MRRFEKIGTAMVVLVLMVASTYLWLSGTNNEPLGIDDEVLPMKKDLIGPVSPSFFGERVSLEEARAGASFELFAPTYLPEDMRLEVRASIVKLPVEGGKDLDGYDVSWGLDETYDSIYFFYSGGSAPTLKAAVDLSPNLYVHLWRLIAPTLTTEEEVRDSVRDELIYEVVKVRGRYAIGIDLGHVNRYDDGTVEPIPATVKWSEGTFMVQVVGMYPLSELIRVAESLRPG